jgi:hypothetical protein
MKKVLMSVLAMGAMTMSANAACSGTACTNVKVTEVYATFGGTIYISTDGDEGALTCTSPGNVYVSIGANDPGKNALYSMMLTAKTTQANVKIRIQSGTDGCRILYANIK